MTQRTLEKLPRNVLEHIEQLRTDYKNTALNKDVSRGRSAEYCKGLRDAGLITDRERQSLFIYTTI